MITQCLRSNDPNCLFILSAALHWIPQLPLIWDNMHYSHTPHSLVPLLHHHTSENAAWPGQNGQTNPQGKKKSEWERDRCVLWEIHGQRGWPHESTEALPREVIVHWDNNMTPGEPLVCSAMYLQNWCILEREVGGSNYTVSNTLVHHAVYFLAIGERYEVISVWVCAYVHMCMSRRVSMKRFHSVRWAMK